MRHVLRDEMLVSFERNLTGEEKSSATIGKYLRDVRCFFYYIRSLGADPDGGSAAATKEKTIIWKEELKKKYAPASVNSMIAGVNHFLHLAGWEDCCVKSLKIQRAAFRSREKELDREEYFRLLEAAEAKGNYRLSCLMQTLASTGIRVSEVPFITAEAVRRGCAYISMKGKERIVPMPEDLCVLLTSYMEEKGIRTGSIFVTRSGKNMDRSNILHEMKALCETAGVAREKVYPHNFRHLFACAFYEREKDIVRLADLLGHSNINTTRIYTAVSMEETKKQLSGMEFVRDSFADFTASGALQRISKRMEQSADREQTNRIGKSQRTGQPDRKTADNAGKSPQKKTSKKAYKKNRKKNRKRARKKPDIS